MKILLLVFLFALTSCDFSQIVKCAFESKKLQEYIPKILNTLKNKDFQALISEGFTAFTEIKGELTECLAPEPNLKCAHEVLYTVCTGGCIPKLINPKGYLDCVQACSKKHC